MQTTPAIGANDVAASQLENVLTLRYLMCDIPREELL